MDATSIISRLKSQCPTLKIIDEALGLDDAASRTLATPSAFVLPLDETATPNAFFGAHVQEITATWGVAIAMPGIRAASRSLSAELNTVREQVRASLAGWTPDDATISPLNFIGGQFMARENNIIWWQDEFTCRFDRRS